MNANTSSQNRHDDDAPRIGELMPKSDWQEAINVLKAKAPDTHPKIYLPKAGGEYGGQVLVLTETHIVQRVGKGAAIAHTLDHLANGDGLSKDIENGRIKPGMQMTAKYGEARGEATVFSFDQHRANEMNKDLKEWAEKNIQAPAARATFLKHVDAATKDLAQGRPPQREAAPAPAPQRSHERAR